MKTYLLALSILLSTQLISSNFVRAGEADDLFNLCSKFPYNSKCKGYEAPIPLDNRLGEESRCLLGNKEELQNCKIYIDEKSLKMYVETGDKLDILDGDRDTKEIITPFTSIQSFSYAERKKVDTGRVIAFGVWGLLAKKKTSTFNFRIKSEGTTEGNQVFKQIVFITSRDAGREMRQSVEEKTGLVPEVFVDIE